MTSELPLKIVLATGNQGKLNELRQLVSQHPIELVSQADYVKQEPAETGLTFIENALIKARNASALSGLPALADDSGLAIDALGGAPGIYSARYAGAQATDQQNIALVLERMRAVANDQRGACFHCVLVYLAHPADPTPLVCHGQWRGFITEEQRGVGGFGYDPIFWVPERQCTAAELTKEQKNALSHRGSALKQLLAKMDSIVQAPRHA